MVKEDTSCDKRVFVIIGGGEFVHRLYMQAVEIVGLSCGLSKFKIKVVKKVCNHSYLLNKYYLSPPSSQSQRKESVLSR